MRPESLYRRSWRSLQTRESRFDARIARAFDDASLPSGLQIRAGAPDEASEILLYDEIGYWGVTAKDFVLALAQIGPEKSVKLRINSPGGDVFDGLAIYNAIKARGNVACVVDGVAASAASFIACAGGSLAMAEQSMLMIHNAWGGVVGDKSDMIAMAEVMAKIDRQLASIYAAKCGKPVAEIAAMMDAETWLTAGEAADVGLCDAVWTDSAQARLVRAPKALAERPAARIAARYRAELPGYDPDGDGDNDAEQALGHLRSAAMLLDAAMDCLTGDDEGQPGEPGKPEDMEENESAAPSRPIVPGAEADVAIATAVHVSNDEAAAAAAESAARAAEAAAALAARRRRLQLAEASGL